MDYNPWPERKFWPNFKANKKEQNLWNWKAYTPKLGAHVFFISLYLHVFFKSRFYFLTPYIYMCVYTFVTNNSNISSFHKKENLFSKMYIHPIPILLFSVAITNKEVVLKSLYTREKKIWTSKNHWFAGWKGCGTNRVEMADDSELSIIMAPIIFFCWAI